MNASPHSAAIVDVIQKAIDNCESADCIDHTDEGECIFPDLATFIAESLEAQGMLK